MAMDSLHHANHAMPCIWLLRVMLLGTPALVSKGAIWQVDLEHAGSLGEHNSISPEAQGHIVLNRSLHCRANMPVHGRPSCQLPFLLVQDLLFHKHVGQAEGDVKVTMFERQAGHVELGPFLGRSKELLEQVPGGILEVSTFTCCLSTCQSCNHKLN